MSYIKVAFLVCLATKLRVWHLANRHARHWRHGLLRLHGCATIRASNPARVLQDTKYGVISALSHLLTVGVLTVTAVLTLAAFPAHAQDTNYGVISALSHLLTDTLDTGVVDYLTPDNTVVTDVHQLPPLLIPIGRRSLLAERQWAVPDPAGAPDVPERGRVRRLLVVSEGVRAQEVRRHTRRALCVRL